MSNLSSFPNSLLAKEATDLLREHSTIPNGSPGRKDEKKVYQCLNFNKLPDMHGKS
jgi:hypothetical protein